MPSSAPHPCTEIGCSALVTHGGRCEVHKLQAKRRADATRESPSKRGYGRKWQEASKGYLRAHPLCECPECMAGAKRTTPAQVVDHIVPHRGDMALFWDRNNWQAMAKACHDRKTATEDGGFGNG